MSTHARLAVTGSVSLGLYRHDTEHPPAAIDLMCAQAQAAELAGFDGVTFSEHHLGHEGYFPNPLYASNVALQCTTQLWAGPMPMLLNLRPPATVVEDLSWMAATYPNRVVVAFAAGNKATEHELNPGPGQSVVERFERGLGVVAGALGTTQPSDWLTGDQAIAWSRGHIPLLSAVRSRTAAIRAARSGMGLLFSPVLPSERTKECVAEYRAAGGSGPCVLIRRVLIEPVEAPDDSWSISASPEAVTDELLALADQTGGDAFNLRVHFPGLAPGPVVEQIQRIGAEVLPNLRAHLRR